MEKGLLCSVDQIYAYINELKKVRRELITNCYLSCEEMETASANKELFYEYKEGCYLNLLCMDDGFNRLYFYITNVDNYQAAVAEKTIVCDVFTKNEDEEFLKLIGKFQDYNFFQYAKFHKWIMRSSHNFNGRCPDGFIVGSEKELEAVSMLFDIFDKYTDHLPRKAEIEMFIKNKKFLNLYETGSGKYLGSLIYTEKKRVSTTDFYFIRKEEKGNGLSHLLHDYYYSLLAKEGYRFETWINVNNVPSIAVHKRYNYQKDLLKKYTLLRESTLRD